MIGQTILHFTPWDKKSGFFDPIANCWEMKLILEFSQNLLSNGVNKLLEKLGEGRLLMTCMGESRGVLNG